MDALAKQSGSIINAVMLGAIAGSGRLPLTAEQFEAAIRADGKSVESNLRGFRAGLEAARAKAQPAKPAENKKRAAATLAALEHEVARHVSAPRSRSRSKACAGSSPIRASAYARLYLDRLTPIAKPTTPAGAQGKLLQGSRAPSRRAHVL